MGLPAILDPIVSLIVALLIIKAGYDIFKDTSSILVDKYVVDNNAIQKLIMTFSEVKNIHRIRSRGRWYVLDHYGWRKYCKSCS